MRKGLSTWLFSKLVMFSFLVLMFGIMTQMIILINERDYNDSAELISFQIKEVAEGVINSNTVSIRRIIPLPEAIPQKSENSKAYYVIINESSSPRAIHFGITKGTNSKKILSASTLVYIPPDIKTNLGSNQLEISSQNYSYLVTIRKSNNISFYACKTFELDPSSGTKVFYKCKDATKEYNIIN